MSVRNFGSIVSLAFALLACSESKPHDPHLLGEENPAASSEEDERLRKMQLVRVVTNDEQAELAEVNPVQFIEEVSADNCGERTVADPSIFTCMTLPTPCEVLTCFLQFNQCAAELALGVASGTGASITMNSFIDGVEREVRVPPQGASTNAALAKEAAHLFHRSMEIATTMLSRGTFTWAVPGNPPESGACTLSDLNQKMAEESGAKRRHEFATSVFSNAYHAGQEAFRVAVDNTLAVSDAELSSTPSHGLAQLRAISKPELSRTAAAHLLVGGAPGFMGSSTDAFCTSGRLSGPETAALGVFREAAPSPEDVVDHDISIDALVNGAGAGAQPANGSLKARLADSWGSSEIPANQELWNVYALTRDDFAAARQFLIEEIDVFARSTTAQLDPKPRFAGHIPAFQRWAATAAPPPERNSAYWTALASVRTSEPPTTELDRREWRDISSSAAIHLDSIFLELYPNLFDVLRNWGGNLSEFVDSGQMWAAHILRDPLLQPETPGAPTNVLDGVFNPLGLLVGDDAYAGRFVQCENRSPYFHILFLTGYTLADNVILVRGEDLLECAVNGSIEGDDCTLPDFTTLPAVSLEQGILRLNEEEESVTYPRYDKRLRLIVSGLVPDGSRWYLLKARQPGNVNPGPGQWQAITGLNLYRRPGDPVGIECLDVPIVPEAIESAAKALAPSREWCGETQESCAETRFDQRLPLEDELADDNDGVESSWRHYLKLARLAATEADQLGQEYVQAGLQADFRQEELDHRQIAREEKAAGAMQRLQEICGTAVDPAELIKALGQDLEGQFDAHNVDQGPGPCSAGETCRAGRKNFGASDVLERAVAINQGQLDLPATPALVELRRCMAKFGDMTTVHLGDSNVCIEEAEPNDRVTIPSGGCADCGDGGGNSRCLSAENGLHFFNTPSVLPPPAPTLCENIRALRASPVSENPDGNRLLDEIIGSTTFALNNVRQLGQSVDVRLDYNAHVTVSVGSMDFTTGRPGFDPPNRWPCVGLGNSCVGGDGLICQGWTCAEPQDRGEINLRLYKAGLAAKLLTWSKDDGTPPTIESPYYIHDAWEPYRGTQLVTGVVIDGIGIETISNEQWRMFLGENVTAGLNARVAHVLGPDTWDAVGPPLQGNGFQRFTIRRARVRNELPDRLKEFWDGMSVGSEGTGYFKSALLDRSASPPASEQAIHGAPNAKKPGDLLFDFRHHDFVGSDGTVFFGTHLYPTLSYDRETLLDALELVCEGALGGSEELRCNLENPPPLSSVEDFEAFGQHIQCIGNEINRRATSVTFELPLEAVQNLNNGGTAHEAQGGDMEEAISQLREALQDVAKYGPIVGGTVQRFGQDIRNLRATLDRVEIDREMADIRLKAEIANQITSCLTSTFKTGTIADVGPGGAAAATVTCANSLSQIGFAVDLNGLEHRDSDAQRDQVLADFAGRVIAYATSLETDAISLSQSLERVKRQTGTIEGLKQEARRNVDSALWHLSRQASNEGKITNVLDNVKEGAKLRYQRALQNAQRMSYLAKRAIEQRLGLSLADMVEDLPLITAPAGWQATVCTTTGIDYEALRESGQGENFADSFIGDYVTKLEQVVESYRLEHNFHEGSDTAIVSLRDDIHNVRAPCVVESRNKLLFASSLETAVIPLGESLSGWEIAGCATEFVDVGEEQPVERALPDCVGVIRHVEAPFFDARIGQRPVPGYFVRFGAEGCTPQTCGWQERATLRQKVQLAPGRYRFSWFTLEGEGVGGDGAGVVRKEDGTLIPRDFTFCDPSGPVLHPCSGFIFGRGGEWHRTYYTFDVIEGGLYSVGFEKPGPFFFEPTIAAPMLEKLDDPLMTTTLPDPPPFMDTLDTATTVLPVCEDTKGEHFRHQKWDRNCIKLCPDGYSSDCRDKLRTECYWETSFHVSQRGIEAGHIFNQSGFARGNFNYRIESVGLNFVGTGLRECEDSNLPATCHGGAFIPYSILHDGPFYVRNHKGQDYRAHLFPGHIEHARGLGAERYLTNPLGDADRSLIEPYLRSELKGRPLDGEFVLRVWDEPGVNFSAIQDVQLVLNYRYWTRFN